MGKYSSNPHVIHLNYGVQRVMNTEGAVVLLYNRNTGSTNAA